MEYKSENKICQNCKGEFLIEPEDFNFYEKIKVPPPTWCPECRLIRRLRTRNERTLFKTTCKLCGENTITMYNPENNFVIYCNSCYLGDKWNPLEYAKEYDFSRTFFEQFADLMKIVPRKALHSIGGGIDTEYSNYLVNAKESYLTYSVVGSEKIYYCRVVDISKECMDSTNIKECELCYENVFCTKNYNCFFLVDSRNCIESRFLFDCINCSNCFMSSNLRNKQYVFKGEQLTKEEYEKKMSTIRTSSFKVNQELMSEFKGMIKDKSIHRFSRIFKSEDCTGDYIQNSKNAKNCFEILKGEDLKYCIRLTDGPKDYYDVTGSGRGELLYEVMGASWGSQNSAFFSVGHATVDSQYCDFCLNVSSVFGSISLNNNKFVILNKQYTKEEYFKLKEKIIKHMNDMPYVDEKGRIYKYGEFFPQICLPFSYNESIAQEYFPLTREEIIQKGYLWRDQDSKGYKPTFMADILPDSIEDVSNDFSKEVISCMHAGECTHVCTKAFRIHPNELSYLKKWKLPLPHLCPNCRYYERINFRNTLKLYSRTCMCNINTHDHKDKCFNKFETSYSPDRPEIVYCEKCYNREVY